MALDPAAKPAYDALVEEHNALLKEVGRSPLTRAQLAGVRTQLSYAARGFRITSLMVPREGEKGENFWRGLASIRKNLAAARAGLEER